MLAPKMLIPTILSGLRFLGLRNRSEAELTTKGSNP